MKQKLLVQNPNQKTAQSILLYLVKAYNFWWTHYHSFNRHFNVQKQLLNSYRQISINVGLSSPLILCMTSSAKKVLSLLAVLKLKQPDAKSSKFVKMASTWWFQNQGIETNYMLQYVIQKILFIWNQNMSTESSSLYYVRSLWQFFIWKQLRNKIWEFFTNLQTLL